MTFAASVLPTPASPSMNSGFCSLRARKIDVPNARSPMYLRSRRRRSTSSMVAGALTLTKSTRQPVHTDSPDEPTCSPQQTSDRPDYPGRWPGSAGRGPPRDSLRALGLLNRPFGQHTGEVLLVFRTCAQVAGRVEPIRRMLRRLFRLGALLERLLDGVRPDRRDADVRQPDPP